MTGSGGKIPNVTTGAIKDRLEEVSDGKAVKRLTVAREYLDGLSPAGIEAKYGYPRQTVYEWLDRIEERGLDAALYDEKPPGREPTLSEDQRSQFGQVLRHSPTEAGYDAPAWTSLLAQEYLREAFGVEFCRRHVRRLMAETGTSSETPHDGPGGP